MKNIFKSFVISFLLIGALSFLVSAVSEPKSEKLVFKSSTVCKTCKKTMEETLQMVDGVLLSLVNLSTSRVSVKFNPQKTNAETIKQAVLKSGYNFNEFLPSKEDFEKLPACCKKGNVTSCNEKH